MSKFELTRAMKPVAGSSIKRILVRCPSTGRLTPTGKTVEESEWDDTKLNRPRLSCPHCNQVHSWTKKDVVLAR
jgi:5-methylcytosine-specific restriction endonuclease McrA